MTEQPPAIPPGELAAAVEEAVRRVPGVTALHRPGPWWAAAVREAGAAAGLVDAGPLVAVAHRPDGSLDVALAVATGLRAAATCRAVHDAVVDRLAASGHTGATVRVTVVRVAG